MRNAHLLPSELQELRTDLGLSSETTWRGLVLHLIVHLGGNLVTIAVAQFLSKVSEDCGNQNAARACLLLSRLCYSCYVCDSNQSR